MAKRKYWPWARYDSKAEAESLECYVCWVAIGINRKGKKRQDCIKTIVGGFAWVPVVDMFIKMELGFLTERVHEGPAAVVDVESKDEGALEEHWDIWTVADWSRWVRNVVNYSM